MVTVTLEQRLPAPASRWKPQLTVLPDDVQLDVPFQPFIAEDWLLMLVARVAGKAVAVPVPMLMATQHVQDQPTALIDDMFSLSVALLAIYRPGFRCCATPDRRRGRDR
ncbi:MAG: hypothetical protein IPK39_16560 [Sulfuritalea sp.]|nr:hypothetical protein [Sulfuritalea sp.]